MRLNQRVEMTPGSAVSRLAALGLLAVAILIVLLLVVLPLRSLGDRLTEDIAHYQRMLQAHAAIAQRRPEVTQAAGVLRDPKTAAELLLAANSDAAGAASMHERVRELIAASRGSLISIQALPAVAEGGHRRVALRVQFAADLPGFQRVLHALEAGRPAVTVNNLYLRARTSRAAGMANPLDVQMDVVAFRKDGQG